MAKYLDSSGAGHLVDKIKALFAAKSHTHTNASTSAAGFMPKLGGGTTNYLRADGTWAKPPDTNTTYSAMKGATTSAAGGASLVPAPAAGSATRYLRSDGTWSVPPDTNTTYSAATQSAAGLMSAADKTKLDGIATGANKTTLASLGITATAAELNKLDGVTATAAELNYMDGVTSNVQTQLNGKAASSHTHTPSSIGAAASSHSHSAATASAAGFMSAADKSKLDGITTISDDEIDALF